MKEGEPFEVEDTQLAYLIERGDTESAPMVAPEPSVSVVSVVHNMSLQYIVPNLMRKTRVVGKYSQNY